MTRLFISYSHEDEPLRAELQKHLAVLKREGLLDLWSDHRIPAGGELDQTISASLEEADIVLLLVSAAFLNSEYCTGIEMQRALERRADGLCDVVPVIIKPCIWQIVAELKALKAIPTDGKAVTKWASHDEAFEDVAKHVVALLEHRSQRFRAARPDRGPASVSSFQTARPVSRLAQAVRSSNLALPRRFTDQDKHDFLQSTFEYIQHYFEGSLDELRDRNSDTEGRIRTISGRAFQAFVFRDGQKEAACYIRIGGSYSQDAIGYSDGDRTDDNSYNDMLNVQFDGEKLFMSASFGSSGREERKLTQEGAAEHFWTKFISPLQQRRTR